MKFWASILFPFLLLSTSCTNTETNNDPGQFRMTAVIEIPAGTNHKIEYDYGLEDFVVDTRDGVERVIEFLPYPANYGFIPGTLMSADEGGDGDAVDVLIVSESLPTGTQIEFKPLTMIKLIDEGELDYKVLGVPKDEDLQIIHVDSFEDLKEKHPALLDIIELWFLNYDADEIVSHGWASEQETLDEIQKWSDQ